VALTAGRGRGKSAALGLAIGAALAHDYSNIFVTSPDPENLKTLFEFVFKALDALGYEEHIDYDVVQSTNPEFKKAIVRVNIFRGHRQTIQYISPEDAHVLGQAELVIIDEAAAIPLPLVRKLIGPYLVFMASTINGYEGTGRSLSIKLIQQLREQTRPTITKGSDTNGKAATSKAGAAGKGGAGLVRSLREIKLDEPIRYAPGDQIEKWLNHLLCLDATVVSKAAQGCPHPSQCELYYVNRDTLFSYHPASEVFLQRMMALYVASHYKNSPNDLQMLSDAPAHHLFVLLPPLKEDDTSLPDPLVVLQVALEGNISREVILKEMAHNGTRSSGDMIPWVISQQFQDSDFAMLSGARVVRIATHPDYARMGYGARALDALDAFYSGKLTDADAVMPDAAEEEFAFDSKVGKNASLDTDTIDVRDPSRMPPLLQRLSERAPEALDYLGVSFGLTPELLRFWKKAGYVPLYASQKENPLTGEYTFVMLRALSSTIAQAEGWLGAFSTDFRQRFMNLLGYESFKKFRAETALSVIAGASRHGEESNVVTSDELGKLISPFDMKRLESYSKQMVDYHVVLDLVPDLAKLFFGKRLPDLGLSAAQQAILLAMGLQRKGLETIETELGAPSHQILALFGKLLTRATKNLQDIHRAAMEESVPVAAQPTFAPAVTTVDEDVREAEREERARMADGAKSAQREFLDTLDMRKFAIDQDADFSSAEKQVAALAAATPEKRARLNTTISVKGAAPVQEEAQEVKKDGKKEKRRESGAGAGGKRKKAKRD
jgi:N-acetyltransferase 10